MNERVIKLLGPSGELLGTGQVVPEGDHFAGSIDLAPMPEALRRIFQEFEGLVNGQIFSLLDDIEQRINHLAIKVAFDDGSGSQAFVEDLQIYPRAGSISFKVATKTEATVNGEKSNHVPPLYQERQLPGLA